MQEYSSLYKEVGQLCSTDSGSYISSPVDI